MPTRNRCSFPRRRRPAVLPVIIGLSLASSVPLVAAQIFPIEPSVVHHRRYRHDRQETQEQIVGNGR